MTEKGGEEKSGLSSDSDSEPDDANEVKPRISHIQEKECLSGDDTDSLHAFLE